jgi:hypothetical protein
LCPPLSKVSVALLYDVECTSIRQNFALAFRAPEGYDSDGDQVVDKFLKERQREKRAEKEAAEAELEAIAAAEAEAAEAVKGASKIDASGVLKTVVFKASAKKREAEGASLTAEEGAEGEGGSKKRKIKKKLDNTK